MKTLRLLFAILFAGVQSGWSNPNFTPSTPRAAFSAETLSIAGGWMHRSITFTGPRLFRWTSTLVLAFVVLGQAPVPRPPSADQSAAAEAESKMYSLIDRLREEHWRGSAHEVKPVEDAAALERVYAGASSAEALQLLWESGKVTGRSIPPQMFLNLIMDLDLPLYRPWALKILSVIAPPPETSGAA